MQKFSYRPVRETGLQVNVGKNNNKNINMSCYKILVPGSILTDRNEVLMKLCNE